MMPSMDARIVLLHGRSLLLSGVAAGLGQCTGLQVTQTANWADASRQLAERTPDALIFDLSETCESHILPLLFENPRLLLIGLDAECNRAVLVSGREARCLTLNEINEIVQRHGL
jgi:hypothetical protein